MVAFSGALSRYVGSVLPGCLASRFALITPCVVREHRLCHGRFLSDIIRHNNRAASGTPQFLVPSEKANDSRRRDSANPGDHLESGVKDAAAVRLSPPTLPPDPVRHLISKISGPAWRVVSEGLGFGEEQGRALVSFGSVYHKPHSAPASSKARRILDPELQVEVDEYLRVFPEPKRYPACVGVDWESTIVYETEELMMVNKPAGVPSHAMVDNVGENMLAGLREVRPGLELLLPHRLDVDTSGLVIVVKCEDTLRAINAILKKPVLDLLDARSAGGAHSSRERESRRARKARQKALRRRLVEDGGDDGGGGSGGGFDASGMADRSGDGDRLREESLEGDVVESAGRRGRRGRLTKRYRALVEVLPGNRPLSTGELTHFLKASPRAPKEFRRHCPQEEEAVRDGVSPNLWFECRMVVTAAREMEGHELSSLLSAGGGRDHGGRFEGMGRRALQEVEVELITGRTHQIRGQLAAEGCPIWGDDLYRDLSRGFPRSDGHGHGGDGDASVGGGHGEVGGRVPASPVVGMGDEAGTDFVVDKRFVASPNLALQACEIVLEVDDFGVDS